MALRCSWGGWEEQFRDKPSQEHCTTNFPVSTRPVAHVPRGAQGLARTRGMGRARRIDAPSGGGGDTEAGWGWAIDTHRVGGGAHQRGKSLRRLWQYADTPVSTQVVPLWPPTLSLGSFRGATGLSTPGALDLLRRILTSSLHSVLPWSVLFQKSHRVSFQTIFLCCL